MARQAEVDNWIEKQVERYEARLDEIIPEREEAFRKAMGRQTAEEIVEGMAELEATAYRAGLETAAEWFMSEETT